MSESEKDQKSRKQIFEEAITATAEGNSIPQDKLRSYSEEWVSALMEKGIIVDLKMGHWRANSKINPEEVGIDLKNPEYHDYQNEYLNLGNKKLLPKSVLKRISSIESRARRNLDESAYKTVWGHFVPHTSFASWKNINDQIRIDFFNEAELISGEWEELTKEVCDDYLKFIVSNYKDKIKKEEFDDTVQKLMLEFKQEIISPKRFKESFEYEAYYTFIPIPSLLEKEIDLKEADKVRQDRDFQASEAQMNKEVMEETMKKKSEHIDEFIEATAGAIGETVDRVLTDVRGAIGEEGEKEIGTRAKKKLMKLIKTVRSLDFFQEEKTVATLNQLEVDLNKTGEEKKTFNDIKGSVDAFDNAAKSMLSNWLHGRANLLEI